MDSWSPEPRFDGGYPEWSAIDRLGQSWAMRAVRGSLTLGKLLQNHHELGQSPSFAVPWLEIDPTSQVMRVLAWLKVIDLAEG